ncbi:MAG TPA: 4-(cytidine 5'-diphospho)-2-C-methyl-D-erythritol kinase [Actinomycetota bacterium]|nr:4-(cytidine 5'-diphospho)-2-C-methyl-D-erythritol kinase [Actinomycetota bacterium]
MAEAVVREPAPAKLNPFLRVLGRRADGFHEIETLIQPVTVADGLEARPAGDGLDLLVVGEYADAVPRGEDNLALRAARALAKEANVADGARLILVKRIPVAAGLGGGSADAAATLRALDIVWNCRLGADRLVKLAAGVGSDVPALVGGGPVLARGKGETVEPVKVMRTWWALMKASFPIRAEDAYRWWDEYGGPVGRDPAPLLAALQGEDPTVAGPLLFNDLEGPVSAKHPQIRAARSALLEAGALGAVMCGSGPTVAGLARDGRHAEELAAAVGGTAVASLMSEAIDRFRSWPSGVKNSE